jgi:hypothetical protein
MISPGLPPAFAIASYISSVLTAGIPQRTASAARLSTMRLAIVSLNKL